MRLLTREDLEVIDYPNSKSGRAFKYVDPQTGIVELYTGWSPTRIKSLISTFDSTRWVNSVANKLHECEPLLQKYENFPVEDLFTRFAQALCDVQRDFSAECGTRVHYVLEKEILQNLVGRSPEELYAEYNDEILTGGLLYMQEANILHQMVQGLDSLGIEDLEYSELFMHSALLHPEGNIPILCFADAVVPSLDVVIDFKTKLDKLNGSRDEYWVQAIFLFVCYANMFGRKPKVIHFLVAGQRGFRTFDFTESDIASYMAKTKFINMVKEITR